MAHKRHAASRAFDVAARGAPALHQRHSCTLWTFRREGSTWLGTSAAWKGCLGGELLLLLHIKLEYTCADVHYSGVLLLHLSRRLNCTVGSGSGLVLLSDT